MKRLLAAVSALALTSATLAPFSPAHAADNTTGKDASGATITLKCKDTGAGVLACANTLTDSAGVYIDPATAGKQDTGNTSLGSIDGKIVAPFAGAATTTITRPADTTAYAVNDTLADSTTAPTTGGFTLSSVCSASGKSGVLTSVAVVSSNDPATTLIGEIWIFDSAPTAVNDNAGFALSDSDALKLVGIVPFALASSQNGSGTNSIYATGGLGLAYTCSGSANLRYLVKVKNAYTPASAETLTVRFNFSGLN